MKCDITLSDFNLPCTKWLPCGEPVKITKYIEIRILTIENETFCYILAIASYLFTYKGINRLLAR